jgi:hypothetical protein
MLHRPFPPITPNERGQLERWYRDAKKLTEKPSKELLNVIEQTAIDENENESSGLGIGWLIVFAVPCWLLIAWVALRCLMWGAV